MAWIDGILESASSILSIRAILSNYLFAMIRVIRGQCCFCLYSAGSWFGDFAVLLITLRGDLQPPAMGAILLGTHRSGGRAVECTGLENRRTRKRIGGSNPSPTAFFCLSR